MNYKNLNDQQKKELINKEYVEKKRSLADIASDFDTYANKIRRDAIKFKINLRDKSQAQKNALKTGKHQHPTKGIQRSEDTKQKIGKKIMQSWEEMSESKKQERKHKAKKLWESKSEDKKKEILKKANIAVRETSKTGSKLEKFLLNELLLWGYQTEFHKEHTLSNTKLQIDIFLPTMGVAIEVDGPSHFLPVWGDNALKKNIKYDQKKEGLILGKGLKLIRVKQTKDFTRTRAIIIAEKLKDILESIKSQKNINRTIEIGDDYEQEQ